MDPQVWQYSLGFKNNDNEMLDPAEVYNKKKNPDYQKKSSQFIFSENESNLTCYHLWNTLKALYKSFSLTVQLSSSLQISLSSSVWT